MIKEEIKIFFTAVMFYTRIPCPQWVDHSHDYLNKASRYLPLIGWILGVATFLVLYFSLIVFPPEIAVILSMIAGILLTGAFHEDGFADVCDAFGGGYEKMRILDIMKDSRVGAYGLIGTTLILLLKFASLTALLTLTFATLNPKIGVLLILVSAHSISRLAAVSVVFNNAYVREDALSKSKPIAKKNTWKEILGATVFGLIPVAILACYQYQILYALLPVLIARILLSRYFNKWIGGYTGDCLGATQQVSEIVFYLSVIAIWKFI